MKKQTVRLVSALALLALLVTGCAARQASSPAVSWDLGALDFDSRGWDRLLHTFRQSLVERHSLRAPGKEPLQRVV